MPRAEYERAYDRYRTVTEETLSRLLPETEKRFEDGKMPAQLCEAMRYSLMAGGKRVRPVLLLACAEMLGADLSEAAPYAAALEMIHTYSLIHDDLPGMDDDDLRRGRPTNHKVFGEGQAILAGDGLLNYAYECLLAHAKSYPEHALRHIRAIHELSVRAGVTGMIAGQCLDLDSEHTVPEEACLTYIDRHKTADLLTAPLLMAAALADASQNVRAALEQYGQAVGIAFQIDDDLLDLEGDAALLGKATGMDADKGKMTWPAMVGIEKARQRSAALWQSAVDSLAPFGEKACFLREFAQVLSVRKK